jgi:murein DD-endopeptidase MepM/ murein hydrolase activator NlpD
MQMADQRVRIDDSFPWPAAVRRMAVFVLMVLPSMLSARATPNDQEVVGIKPVTTPDHVCLFIENRRAYDVTVTLTIHSKNARVMRIVPETATCGGHGEIEAVRIARADPDKPWYWRYHFRWAKGRADVRHSDATRYRLPFRKGESHEVCQGYNGRWTHYGQDRYAVDFAMPEGTTVCAAREGIVVDLQESSKTGGPDRKYQDQDNYVSITHADGTIGEYHHLKYDGVLVGIGDRVTAGQAIALSGNTGYSTRPHLHFGVYSVLRGSRRQSHRLTFVTREGIAAEPIVGKTYTAE